jgi:tripartite-type tricarboxylate transporter receptor subunit TctC
MMRILAALSLVLVPALSAAQSPPAEFPPSQIRIVVPFTAGGGTDVIARLVGQHLTDAWKVTVLIDNRVGAGGVIGSQWVAQQPPDGRTFLAVASAPSAGAPPSTAPCLTT